MRQKVATAVLIISIRIIPILSDLVLENECSSVGQCSQICNNTSTRCSCIDGFQLQPDGESCEPTDPPWRILWYNRTAIGYIERNGTVKDSISMETNPKYNILPVAFTYDARAELFYWLNFISTSTTKTGPSVILNYIFKRTGMPTQLNEDGFISPNSIAFDWITKKLYLIEPTISAITVCSKFLRKPCAIVLSKDSLAKGASLTLHPNLGIMFWLTSVQRRSAIYRAGMDGSGISSIVQLSSIISSIAVDQGGSRLYWVAERDNRVTSTDFEGNNKKTVALQNSARNSPVRSIAVFGDKIFWISGGQNGTKQTVQMAHKFWGESDKNYTQVDILGAPIDIKGLAILHPASQPVLRKNPCEDVECSNLCVLSPPSHHPQYLCLSCPISTSNDVSSGSLSCNERSCRHSPDSYRNLWGDADKLVVSHENILSFSLISANKILQGNLNFERVRLPQIGVISGIAYYTLQDKYVVTDSKKIYEYDPDSESSQVVVEDESKKIISMEVDEIGGNLYWIDDSGGVNVMSLSTKQKVVLIDGLEGLCDILIVPEQSSFVLASLRNITGGGGIDFKTYLMNGSPTDHLYSDPNPKGCIRMSFDYRDRNILWTETGQPNTIGRIYVHRGSGNMSYASPVISPRSVDLYPSSVVTYGNTVIWVDSKQININRLGFANNTILTNQLLPEGELCRAKLDSSSPTSLTVINRTRSNFYMNLYSQTCGERNCSHMCIATRQGSEDKNISAMCLCSSGFSLDEDGEACIGGPEDLPGDPPPATVISGTVIISISVVSVILISAASAVLVYYLRHRKSPQPPLSETEIDEFFKGARNSIATGFGRTPYDAETWEISKDSFIIETQQILGTGEFGVVRQVSMSCRGVHVVAAAKSCQPGSSSALRRLLSEIKIMSYLGKHENVVSLIGAYTNELDKGLVHVFVEFCELGSLLHYLRRDEPAQSPTLTEMNQWSNEIVRGMEFLADKKVVHADLAARNVLLTSEKTAKISDFGLSRKLYNYSMYVKKKQEPLPWRWMSPECLYRMEFTEKSDVWAFGVTLWEIYSLGNTPYPGLSWEMNFANRLVTGFRLEKPSNCEDKMYSIMKQCWTIETNLRPTFAQLKKDLVDATAGAYMEL